MTITTENVDLSSFNISNCGSNSNNSLIKINASNCVITDNNLNNGENGIYITNSSSTTIYYNKITNCNRDGIFIENSNSNTIDQITIKNIVNNGINLSNVSTNTEINHIDIKNCNLNGIFCYVCSNISISNCTILNCEENGIHFNNSCNNNEVIYSNISNNDKNGIYLNDLCNNNIISVNSFNENSEDATGYNTYAAIRIENSSICRLGNNMITNNYFYGIMIVGENNIVHNSSILKNKKHGIFLFGDNNNQINDNLINKNSFSGIRSFNSTNNNITRNIISNNRNGTYLNYYTSGCRIWNNYFHDNSIYNAFDISLDKNDWDNSTYGNYWDDFDEISDNINAIDLLRDGIFDNYKSIDLNTQDNYPISDIISPDISNIFINPITTTQGGYINISVEVSDDISDYFTDTSELKDVRIIMTDPNDLISNFSIFQNRSGSTYYCNKVFSTIGNYSFFIKAKDPMNWSSTTNPSYFNITEGDKPSITDNSLSTGEAGGIFVVNATVIDDSDENLEVYVYYQHGDESGNETMTEKSSNYFEYSIELDNSISQLSYFIFARDIWKNAAKTEVVYVDITDTISPEINILKHDYESDGFIHTYEIEVEITDNYQVANSFINYWINNGTNNTALMDKSGNNYQKTIYLQNIDDIVYCIINATDESGNTKNTKKPYANAGGSYSGIISAPVKFNGSNSYDLDGYITNYTWDFGDGNSGIGEISQHTYSTNGTYIISLTVQDNDGFTNIQNSTIIINRSDKTYAETDTLKQLENSYNISFSEAFYCYDTDGDSIVDYFYDPNNLIENVHNNKNIYIDGKSCFLLKPKNQNEIFLWNTDDDLIIEVNNSINIISQNEESTDFLSYVNITINKTNGWIYLEVDDQYIDSALTVLINNTEIFSDRIWRENNKIYVLDDPETIYSFIYNKTTNINILESAHFIPNNNSNLYSDNPTIIIEYNTIAYIDVAEIIQIDGDYFDFIINDFSTNDYITYSYTFLDGIDGESYKIKIYASDDQGNQVRENYYFNYVYVEPTDESINILIFLPYLGAIIGIVIVLFIIFRKKNISFESFIYFKNKKIIPFFKPLVFGPLRLNINQNDIQKAEIYVNGALKETLTDPPFSWDYDKRGFTKTRIETKIFSNDGVENSTGEMTFYVFNNRFLR